MRGSAKIFGETNLMLMKLKILLAGLIVFSPMISIAAIEGEMIDLITTASGKAYQHCRIFKIDPDGVFFAHSLGSAKILYRDMTESMKTKLGYDPIHAAEYAADALTKQKKQREQQYELRKEVIKAQAFAQEIARRINDSQPNYAATTYAPPLSEWVGTVPTIGWSAGGYYPFQNGFDHYSNWSPRYNCNSTERYRQGQFVNGSLHHGAGNFFIAGQHNQHGYAGSSACFNNNRPTNGFFAVPALRTATPPLSVNPPRCFAGPRPVVSHY